MSSTAAIERLVIRPPNWLGDAVMALPAMAAVRRAYAHAHLTVVAPPAVAGLFREVTPAAPDRVLELPRGSKPAIATLAGGRFDAGLLFPNSFGSAWQFYRAGVRDRWGYPTAGRGMLLTRRSPRPPRKPIRPHVDYYRALVRGLGIACADDEWPRMEASPRSAAEAEALLARHGCPSGAPLAVLLPGAANSRAKQWPPDRMAELAARLVRERGVVCAIGGAAHDRPAARTIESWLRARAPQAADRVLDLTGQTALGTFAGVLARATVCVTNDAGGMHVASALGRPVVAIFGPTDERSTSPAGEHDLIVAPAFCRPCMLRECPIDHRCMKRVFEAASARVKGEGAR
jgi:heptosyltransferase-2